MRILTLAPFASYTNPARSLELLERLEAVGFVDKAFALLHHFDQPQKIKTHRDYCEKLCAEGKQFRTSSNPLVQRRMEKVWDLYRAGGFTTKSPELIEHLCRAVLIEIPHEATPAGPIANTVSPRLSALQPDLMAPSRIGAKTGSTGAPAKRQLVLFNDCIERIKREYATLGHKIGWRFLCVAKANLNPATKIALITTKPGGSSFPSEHPPASCEHGSAYLVEQWGNSPRGQHALQVQVQQLFSALASSMGEPASSSELLEHVNLRAYRAISFAA